MSQVFFSVIIPSYNSAETVSKSIHSVLQQSFAGVEIIVVDDGSTDGTKEIVQGFGNKCRYLKQNNSGPSAARNYGASVATGRYFVFLDADDWLSEEYLAHFYQLFLNTPAELGLGFIRYQDQSGKTVQLIQASKNTRTFSYGMPGSFVLSRDVFNALNGYDVNLWYSENSDLFLRVEIDYRIDVHKVLTTPEAGVCKPMFDRAQRNRRYSKKKYESVAYFIEKHRQYLATRPGYFSILQRILALGAMENREPAKARKVMSEVVARNPLSVKDYLRYFLFWVPPLARFYYKTQWLIRK
jgi:glycosyltransferase involved in cell wall biosynthesis